MLMAMAAVSVGALLRTVCRPTRGSVPVASALTHIQPARSASIEKKKDGDGEAVLLLLLLFIAANRVCFMRSAAARCRAAAQTCAEYGLGRPPPPHIIIIGKTIA